LPARPWHPYLVLLGRTQELARIDEGLAEARLGRGQSLLVHGEPGIGKTELLAYAVGRAGESDMNVLSARGVEFEADVPYAGLHQLLLPAFGLIDRLPAAQALALRSSLGLGQRIEADRLVIGAATLGLLSAYAERTPLLVVVDDVHWLDAASAEALAFAARRLVSDPVAVLVGLRTGEASPFFTAGIPEIAVGGLDRDSATALLERAAGRHVAPDVAAWLLLSTAGNPLALIELGPDASGLSVPATDAPLPVTTSVERAYLRRAANLSVKARQALLLLAASGTAEPGLVVRAADKLELGLDAVEEAEAAAGLIVSRQGRLEFVHPLARAAAYHAASAADRRAAHRALAEVMTDPDDVDRKAWHLAAATTGPDRAVASLMDELGARARARTAYSAAASAFQEAGRLTEDPELRAARLARAADSAWLAGRSDESVTLIEEAARDAEGADIRWEIQGLLGHIRMRQGHVENGYELLVEAATAIKEVDRLKAITFLGDACVSAYGFGNPGKRLDAARLALQLITSEDPPELQALAHVAYGTHAVLAASGSDGPAHMRQSVALFAEVPAERMDPLLLLAAGIAGLFLREAEAGRHLLDRALLLAREHAPTGALPMLVFFLARDAAATDRWALAGAYYDEAVHVSAETKQSIWQANSLAGLAWLEAYEGKEEECRSHASLALQMARRHEMGFVEAWSLIALGQLEIGLGHFETAVKHLLACEVELDRFGIKDPDLAPAPDLIDAYVRLGRRGEALKILEAYVPLAEAKGQPFALARSTRAKALLLPDTEMAAGFTGALVFHAQTPDTFERARTELFFGERLRRARRRREAREQLRAALRTFEHLGAEPWAERAFAELRASGETVSARDDRRRLTLTPQELRVAMAIAEGRTTREAAAKLYLSPKTIEYHLRSVYDKLEIRSREELASALRKSETSL
jgi:DNA-binding CsgD family transcriptional regulator